MLAAEVYCLGNQFDTYLGGVINFACPRIAAVFCEHTLGRDRSSGFVVSLGFFPGIPS